MLNKSLPTPVLLPRQQSNQQKGLTEDYQNKIRVTAYAVYCAQRQNCFATC